MRLPTINPTQFWPDGSLENRIWLKDGKVHRTDGPAIEWFTGTYEYRLDGISWARVRTWENGKTRRKNRQKIKKWWHIEVAQHKRLQEAVGKGLS